MLSSEYPELANPDSKNTSKYLLGGAAGALSLMASDQASAMLEDGGAEAAAAIGVGAHAAVDSLESGFGIAMGAIGEFFHLDAVLSS